MTACRSLFTINLAGTAFLTFELVFSIPTSSSYIPGIRVAVSTQSPTALPEELLELTSVAILHRFHSKDWYGFLSKKLPLPPNGFHSIQNFLAGEALVFSGMNHCEEADLIRAESDGEIKAISTSDDSQNVFRVKIRERLTADGGISRRNNI